MEFQAKWIRTSEETGGVCPVFRGMEDRKEGRTCDVISDGAWCV